ncbi:MAG: hypothetical protein AB1489_00785 [Acidobacteriota bacterium]
MNDQIRQATADFELFLSGKRAPALIGQSLATMVRMDPSRLVALVMNWARQNREQPFIDTLMGARNKVFDIFFYRVVKFETIYDFFPSFEHLLINACPIAEQGQLTALFQQYRWQDIRPLGNMRDQQQFVIERRHTITVQSDKFNDALYKNTTFSVLSADRRYIFSDEKAGEQIADYQARVQNIFYDFIDLVKDKQQKKEILIANESDRYNLYKKEAFKIETYINQMVDLGIAFFNDDFLYQSVEIFSIIRELRNDYKLKLEDLKRFQDKGDLLSTQKIEDYTTTHTGCMLVKSILSLFTYWNPQRLLNHLQIEENRRVRRVLLKAIECYGKDVYRLLVTELDTRARTLPWYYLRNLAYLIGRINCNDEDLKNRAVELLNTYWQSNTNRALVSQIISTLGSIGTDLACEYLVARLRALEPNFGKDRLANDYCQKVILALIAMETDKAIEAAIEFLQKHEQLGQHIDKFNKIYLSEQLLQLLTGKIRKEIQRLRFSFSLLGDKETAHELLCLVAHMANEPVQALCRDIIKSLPRKHTLVNDAERIIQQPALPLYSRDHVLQKLAVTKNLPEMVCYINETGLTGRLVVQANEEIEGEIDFERGEAVRAIVSSLYLERESAFYWCFLLDPRDIKNTIFHLQPSAHAQLNLEISRPIEVLICDGLVQRGEVLQIAGNFLAPDSRFTQKAVNKFYTNFDQTDDPDKYRLVWEALEENCTIAVLQVKTRLSKRDIYKILFYFLKQNMLIVDGEREQQETLNLEDGLAMLDMNMKRIERRPVMFNYYKTAAEVCADLMRASEDEVLRFALGVLRNYYLDYYQNRKVLATVNLEICQQVLVLTAAYLRSHSGEDRETLLNYISFTFTETLAQPAAPQPDTVETTVLEKLENIDLANDPLDEIASSDPTHGFDESMVDEMFGSLDSILGSGLGQEADTAATESAGLTAAEESMIRDLFDNIALAYVKPLKDFIRELYRNWEAARATSLEWTELIEPIFTLLSGSSAKMGYQQIADVVNQLQNLVTTDKAMAAQEGRECFSEEVAQKIITTYQKLCELQPKTFALVISEEDLADRKEVLIVKFILKQVPEVNEKILNKILFAGLNTFDKFMQSRPDEIAALTGMTKILAEEICLKFYQYRNIYYQHGDSEYQQKFLAMFELNLRLLKEMHTDVEILTLEEQMGKEDAKGRKEILKMERQRTLWSLFILLCIKEQYDLVETIQQSVFEVRIQLLEEYFTKLAATSQDAYQAQ